jgi:hypothetical protein
MTTRSGDTDVLTSLEPTAARLLDRHLATSREWTPHTYVPWSSSRDYDGPLQANRGSPDILHCPPPSGTRSSSTSSPGKVCGDPLGEQLTALLGFTAGLRTSTAATPGPRSPLPVQAGVLVCSAHCLGMQVLNSALPGRRSQFRATSWSRMSKSSVHVFAADRGEFPLSAP